MHRTGSCKDANIRSTEISNCKEYLFKSITFSETSENKFEFYAHKYKQHVEMELFSLLAAALR